MKTWLITRGQSLFLLLSLATSSFSVAGEIPYLLEIKNDTSLYDRPSLKGKTVASAEAGTTLLFVERSKKGLWVKLKDGDGLAGWIPVQGTDLNEVLNVSSSLNRMQENSKQDNFGDKKVSLEEQQREILDQVAAQKSFDPFLRLAPLVRWLSDSEPVSTRLGIRVDYSLAHYALGGRGRTGRTWAVAEATFPSPQVKGADFTAALRYAGRAPLWGPFHYGPDLGYSIDKVKSKYRNHASFGLAVGPTMGPFDLMFRGGYDFFSRSRASFEIQVGASF